MKNPLTPAGIEPATYRFVAQHLNHCATAVPNISFECVLKKVQASVEDVNFLGQTDLALRKTESLLASSKKVGLAVMLRKLCVS